MILRCVCWSIFLLLALGPAVEAQVTVDDQGYQNVMISFAPNVPSEDGKEIIEEIQDELQSMSRVLHKAIGIPIASVTFLIPSNWTTDGWKNMTITPASPAQMARKVDIRVDGSEDSPFTRQPVALQYGGCAVPGHQIILNLNFIGPVAFPRHTEGKLLAREWLKYRYGVFDENGFTDDPLYPAYYRIPGKPEIKIAECTNSEVKYIFKQPIVREECDLDQVEVLNCRTDVDEISALNVTSSLMYFHKDLPRMEHVCGKEGHPHNSLARNKQNALCNGRSIWEVVKSSEDFKKIQQQPADPKPIQFSYIQESKPRFVVLLENTDKFFENGIPSAVRFALRRFYYDLPPQSKFALYTFSGEVTEGVPYTEIPSESRKDLGPIADFGSPATTICTSCGLEKATQILLGKSEVESGSILLITASPLDKTPELSEKLKESGICLHLMRFTDEDNPVDQTYDDLAKSFYCFTQDTLHMSLDVVDVFNNLFRFLKNPALKFDDEFVSKIVASGNVSAQTPLTIPRDEAALQYTLWLGRSLGKDSIECKAGEADVELKTDTTAADIASFTFAPVEGDITCKIVSTKLPPALTQVQMKTQRGHDFIFDTWVHDMSTEKEQLPILIYAKIYFGEYPVKEANVTLVVTSGNRQEVVKMLDNGRGDPDTTQYDGIYSGYFANFWEAGNYEIRVKIDDNQGQAKIGKDAKSLVPDACCGSRIVSKDHDIPAFSMEKVVVYAAQGKRPEDGYPPSRIPDLQAQIFKNSDKVILMWTAPGGGKAVRYVIKLFENRNDAVMNFDSTGRELNSSSKVPGDTGKVEGFIIPFVDLDNDVTYFTAIRSLNEFNKQSEVSNVAEFVPRQEQETTESTTFSTPSNTTDDGNTKHEPAKSSNKTVGIVLGVLGGLAVLCILVYLGYYFFVKKPRRS